LILHPALELLEDRTVPSHGLISWWTGDDTAADVLGKNDGTLNGGAGYAPGVVRDAFQFNGVDGYFQAPTNDFPTGNQDRTLDLWVNINTFVAPEAFFGGYGAFGSNNQTYQLGASGNTLFFSQWGNAVFGPSLNAGTWYNLAVTNVGDSVTLYLNGQAVATGNLTIDTPTGTHFYMGRIPGGLGDTRLLDGEVDEARVFRRALNSSEINAIYQSDLLRGSRGPHGLISWWTGDDTAADVLGKNDGTLNGGAGYAPGVVRDAFQFNGVDGYFQAPTNDFPTGNQDRTLDLWVNINTFVASEAFFGGYGAFGSNNQSYQLGASGNTLFFSQWGNAVFGPSLNVGTWYSVAVTNVANSVTLYLNGQAVATGNLTIDTPTGTQFYMGRIPGSLGDTRLLDGEADQARVFGRALNSSEINAIYQSDLLRGEAPVSISSGLAAADVASILATSPVQAGPNAVVVSFKRLGNASASALFNSTTQANVAVLDGALRQWLLTPLTAAQSGSLPKAPSSRTSGVPPQFLDPPWSEFLRYWV
jgi:hypothetical protein